MRVKILVLGRQAKEIDVGPDTTVEAAIAQAGFKDLSGYTRHVNGSPAFDTDMLAENSIVTCVPSVKGGGSEG